MYKACRHIKSSGDRCESPALHGRNFCFFHDRLHTDASNAKFDTLRLPVSEDLSAILLALNRISNAIIDSRIDTRRAAQLIWIQQLALQVVNRRDSRNEESIQTVAQNALGEELAPPLDLCVPGKDCQTCVHNEVCTRSPYLDEYETGDGIEYQYKSQDTGAPTSCAGEQDHGEEDETADSVQNRDGHKDHGEDQNGNDNKDDEDQEDDTDGNSGAEDDGDPDHSGDVDDDSDLKPDRDAGHEEGGGDEEDEEDDDEDDDDDEDEEEDDDCFDKETTEELIAGAKYLESVTNAIDNGDMRLVERLLKE